MQHQTLLSEVREEFRHVVMEVEDSAAMGLYDTHRIAEKLMLAVLRITLGWPDLRNLNSADKRDHPAIDLGSDARRVGIQITATAELDKIKDSLTTFIEHELDKYYDRVIFFILTKRQASYSQAGINKILGSKISFEEKQDVIDHRDLLEKIAYLAPPQITEIRDILRSYRLAQARPVIPAWLMKAEPSLQGPPPFTTRWLLFSERKIPLIGRTRDMESLELFMKGESMFQWWAICGPAGIGKTRLAHELILRYQGEWLSGFRDCSFDVDFEALTRPGRPTLVVIDYAARDVVTVRALLLACRAGAAHSRHKVRVLLLEREAGKSTEWWRELVEADDAVAAQIRNSRFREPLWLRSLTADTVVVMKSWLEAGAPEMVEKLPASNSAYWKQLKEVSKGRPLLIALAAAAFRVDPNNVRAPTLNILLRAFLTRELRQWQYRCSDAALFEAGIRLVAVGTLIRGLPLPTQYHSIFIRFVQESTNPVETPVKESIQMFTLEEISQHPFLSPHFARMFKQTTAILGEIVPAQQLPTTYKQVMEFCPLGGSLQPDLIGEFFLDELWRPRIGFEEDSILGSIPESMLGSIMEAAWRLNPSALLGTIETLKKTTTSPSAYLEFLAAATSAACKVKIADLAAEMLSRLLFNATVKIVDSKTSPSQAQEVFGLLSMLKDAYPESKGVAYRCWKVQYSRLREKKADAEALVGLRDFLSEAPGLVEYMKTYAADRFELSWAEMLIPLANWGMGSKDEALILEVLTSAAFLFKEFAPVGELKSTLVNFCRPLATFLAEISGDTYSFSADLQPIVERCLPLLMAQVIEISASWTLDQSQRRAMSWAMVNVMYALAKLGNMAEVLSLYDLASASVLKVDDVSLRLDMRAKLLFNCQTAHLGQENLTAALEIQTEVRQMFTRRYSVEGATAYLAMIGRMMVFAVERDDVFLQELVALAWFSSRLRDDADIVKVFSDAFTQSRLGILLPARASAYVAIFEAHTFPCRQENTACWAIYSANRLSASMMFRECEDASLEALGQLLVLARRHPAIENVADNLSSALLRHWFASGKPNSLSVIEGGEVRAMSNGDVCIIARRSDGSILFDHLFSSDSLLEIDLSGKL